MAAITLFSIFVSIAFELGLVTCASLIPSNNCKSDYYIKEYHYHPANPFSPGSPGSPDVSSAPSDFIPQELKHQEEIASLQKELIEEKNKRQRDVHNMLRIVDRLLKRKDQDQDERSKIRSDDDPVRFDANDTTDLRREWESSTKKFRREKKRLRKERGQNINFQDPQLRSDEAPPPDLEGVGPRNEAQRDASQYDDVTKVVRELQKEVKSLQARQMQVFRAYKKANMQFRSSTISFRQTMDKHQRLQMFHTSEVARLKWQLSNKTDLCREQMRQMQDELECVIKATGSAHSCEKLGLIFTSKAKSKQVRDVSQQVDPSSRRTPKHLTIAEETHFDASSFEPKTMTVIIDDPMDPANINNSPKDSDIIAKAEDLLLASDLDLGENIASDLDLNEDNDPGLTLTIHERETDVEIPSEVRKASEKVQAASLVDGKNEEDGIAANDKNSLNRAVTSLSIRGLWDLLVKAGKTVVTWSELRQSQKLPTDCSDIDLWSQRWSPKQKVYIGADRIPTQVECNEGWLVIQKNEANSTTEKSWDPDSYDIGILSKGFFWIGNRYLSIMTSDGQYTLRVELVTFANRTLIVEYSKFKIALRDDSYRLEVSDITKDETGDILGNNNVNPITGFEFIVPILPVTLPVTLPATKPVAMPSGDKTLSTEAPYRELTTLRGWWYPRRNSMPNTTAQTHLPNDNVQCYTHLNAEHPFYCDVDGDVIKVKSTRMMVRRNYA